MMEFIAKGTIFLRSVSPEIEVEGNSYKLSKADCLKIVKRRQLQGYYTLESALNGAEAKVKITRGSDKAFLVD